MEGRLKPTVLCIQGATASGKTALAIETALAFGTAIISADSRQFYQEMNIGTAKPTSMELEQVPHYFVNNRSISDPMNVQDFYNEASVVLHKLLHAKGIAVVVGGSGQFVDALLQGMDSVPVYPELRKSLEADLAQFGLDSLVEQLAQRDPTILEHIDLKNSRRVLRALEVSLGSGKSWLSFQEKKTNTSFEVLRFVISWPREVLYSRINLRVDQMILEGLEAEVFGLNHLAHLAPMNTVGYKEWIDFFKGKTNREFVINTIKQHTRNYAKRQLTWLNRYDQLTQLDPLQPVGLFEQLKDSLEKYH